MLFLKDHVASIHMIATLSEFRRMRVATTVTLEAVRRARKEKADLVWLRTRRGGIGEKVYARSGLTCSQTSYRTLRLSSMRIPTYRPNESIGRTGSRSSDVKIA